MLTNKKYSSRSSPPFHTSEYKNLTRKDNNKNKYISTKKSSGILKTMEQSKTPYEYYVQYFDIKQKYDYTIFLQSYKKIQQELKTSNIHLSNVYKWKSFQDDLSSAVADFNEKIEKKLLQKESCSVIVLTEYQLFRASCTGKINFYEDLRPFHKQTVIDIFKKYFKKNVSLSKKGGIVVDIK
jgi:hypothetical protein